MKIVILGYSYMKEGAKINQFNFMKVTITKQWETVFFEAGQGSEAPQKVELNIDYEKSIFTLNTESEEAVSYKFKTASQAILINKACLAAIKYAEEKLKA